MKNYLVTFYWQNEVNNELSTTIRKKLELESPEKWLQIFPNQIVIKSEKSISELFDLLSEESAKVRISIAEISKCYTNEFRSNEALERLNVEN